MFKTIKENAEAIVVEKKSKFIADTFYIESEEEAEEILTKIKKKYYDARHHCFAYRIRKGEGIMEKQSDDGEPQGTAGSPMLNILEKTNLVNVLVVVTRYFGGTLLGTGGLVKAYTESTQKALEISKKAEKEEGYVIETVLGYDNIGKFEHFCTKNNIRISQKEYLDKIKILIEVSKEKYNKYVEKSLKDNFQNIPIEIKTEKIIDNYQTM